MSNGKKPYGYTIVEAMFFLLITGVLLTSALLLFQGRRAETQFRQAVVETDTVIRKMFNEVSAGRFPDGSSFRCAATGSGIEIDSSEAGQGTNQGCVFLGKVLQFGPQGNGCEVDGNLSGCGELNIYTVAAQQHIGSSGSSGSLLQQARPTVVQPITQHFTIPGGIYVSDVLLMSSRVDNCPCSRGSIALYNSLLTSASSDPVGGAESVNIHTISGTRIGQAESEAIERIQDTGQYGINPSVQLSQHSHIDANPDGGFIVCLSDGSRNGAVKIGGLGAVDSTEVLLGERVPQECVA